MVVVGWYVKAARAGLSSSVSLTLIYDHLPVMLRRDSVNETANISARDWATLELVNSWILTSCQPSYLVSSLPYPVPTQSKYRQLRVFTGKRSKWAGKVETGTRGERIMGGYCFDLIQALKGEHVCVSSEFETEGP